MTSATRPRPSRAPARDIRAAVDEIRRDRVATLRGQQVAPGVLESWERCVRYGLEPGAVTAKPAGNAQEDARLIEIVDEALASRTGPVRESGVCLSLTDGDGVVLKQWVGSSEIMKRFEELSIVPGYSVAETTVGNSSGSTLVTRAPAFVRGPEHFAPQFGNLTSAGNVITHPITRRVLGTLNLTCRFEDTTPMALAWVCEMVADIERRLLEASTTAERLLLQGFLHENRDSRHAVIAVSSQTAITNVAATKLIGSVDRAQLWSYATKTLEHPEESSPTLITSDGSALRVHRSALVGSGDSLGVVLRLTRMDDVRPRKAEPSVDLPGLAGHSRRWTSMRQRLAAIGAGSVLLVGESGVGKRSIAAALAGYGARTVDLARSDDPINDIRRAVAVEPETLVLLRVDSLAAELAAPLAAALERLSPQSRLMATSRTSPSDGPVDIVLRDLLHETVPVPTLKDRAEDVAAIIAVLTERHTDLSRTIHWMPEAVQALTRREWPDNVRSLDRLVKHVVRTTTRDYVGLRDLPVHVISRSGRRQLIGLERMEAEAIVQALRDNDWNKQQAADSLGIARSTLYRKMQSLGIAAEATF